MINTEQKYMQWTSQLVINQRVKLLVKRKVIYRKERKGKADKLVEVTTMGIGTDDETGQKIRVCVSANTKSGHRSFLVKPEQLYQPIESNIKPQAIKSMLKMGYATQETL